MSGVAERTLQQRLSALGRAVIEPWLAPSDPRALAICRLILFGFAWPGFHAVDVSGFAAYRHVTFHPIGILGALHVPVVAPAALYAIGAAHTVCSGLALLGLFYRGTALVTAFTGVYLDWIVQSSGKTNHGGLLFIWALFVLGSARAADAWSVDAWWRRHRGLARPLPSAEYRWPVRFLSVLVASMYGAAGISKLTTSGLAWGYGGSLRWRLLAHQFTHHPPTGLGVVMARSSTACRVLGLGAELLELSSPLSQLHRYLYRAIIPSLALLQLAIFLSMGVLFKEMAAIFLCLLPWDSAIGLLDRALASLRAKPAGESAL
jgi:hypothetical protein